MTLFLRLHQKGIPVFINVDTVRRFLPKIKGKGACVIDDLDSVLEVDETAEQIADTLGELEIDVLEIAND